MKKLLFAIPKGRILQELNPLFSKAGIIPESEFFDENSRKIIFKTNLENLEMIKVRSFDVATFVKFGGADLGVCGFDVLEEFSSKEIFPILDLKIGKCRLSMAGQKKITPNSHIRVATKYPNLSAKYFSNLGIQAEVIKLNGSIEIAPSLGLSDVIVDLVSSGKTLAENDMIELEKILDVTSHLIVNRTSFKTANHEINQIIKLIDATS